MSSFRDVCTKKRPQAMVSGRTLFRNSHQKFWNIYNVFFALNLKKKNVFLLAKSSSILRFLECSLITIYITLSGNFHWISHSDKKKVFRPSQYESTKCTLRSPRQQFIFKHFETGADTELYDNILTTRWILSIL